MHRNCQWLDHGCFGKWDGGRQLVNHAARHDDVLSEGSFTPVLGGRNSQHLPPLAQIHLALAAKLALAAVDGGIEGDRLVLTWIGDARPGRGMGTSTVSSRPYSESSRAFINWHGSEFSHACRCSLLSDQPAGGLPDRTFRERPTASRCPVHRQPSDHGPVLRSP